MNWADLRGLCLIVLAGLLAVGPVEAQAPPVSPPPPEPVPVEPALLDILGTYLDSRRDRFPGTARQRGVTAADDPWAWWRKTDPLFVDRSGERMQIGALQYLVELRMPGGSPRCTL